MKYKRSLPFYGILIAFASTLFSCLPHNDTNNYQSFNGLIGTVIVVENKKMFCADQDGTYLYDPTLSSFQEGQRLVLNAKITSENQILGTYYLVAEISNIQKFPLKDSYSFDSIEKDTFRNDPIKSYSIAYINFTNNRFLYTTLLNYNASNLYHTFYMVNNRKALNDTLKFEIRHNNKQDSEQSVEASTLISFDITQFLDTIPTGKLKVIQISYKLNSITSKQYIQFTKR